jgi:hypothetical protein
MTTIDLNKTLEELKFEFSDINGRIDDAFSIGKVSISSIVNNSNKTKKKNKYVNIDNATSGVQITQKKFAEAENELLNKSSMQIASANITNATKPLYPYQNYLPFGVPDPNPTHVNEELYAVKEKTWEYFSKNMGKIFQKIGKAEVDSMLANGSRVSGTDVHNMVYSTCGSLSEWPQINPKSAGMGKCASLFAVFDKHYNKYMGGIDESKFYSDLMSSLHTCEIFALSGKKKTTAITGFSSQIKTYNINPNLWFPSDNIKNEAVYNGFAGNVVEKDSYGAFFSIGGFPIALSDFDGANGLRTIVEGNNGELPLVDYTRYTGTMNAYKKFNYAGADQPNNGAYMSLNVPGQEDMILNNKNIMIIYGIKINDGGLPVPNPNNKLIKKRYCSLFLNEANKNDINKIDKIEHPINYLFNYKSNGIFPGVCFLEAAANQQIFDNNLKYWKNSFIITQRIPEIGILLFLRRIFEEIYPIQAVYPTGTTPAGAVIALGGAGNGFINIFQEHSRIVGNQAVNPAPLNEGLITDYAGIIPHSSDTINIVLQKLASHITKYITDWRIIANDYVKNYIEKLFTIINEIKRNNNIYTIAVGTIANPSQAFVRDFITEYTAIKNAFFNNQVGNFTFSQANINNFFNAGGGAFNNDLTAQLAGAVHNNNAGPVLVYRYFMARLITDYHTKYHPGPGVPAVIADTNKYNLYRDITNTGANMDVINLTKAQPLAAAGQFNDFTDYKQTIPNINPIMVGGGSKHRNHHQIKTGGSKIKSSYKKIQKGGGIDTLFIGDPAGGPPIVTGLPRLYANRQLDNFNSSLFESAVKKYKEFSFNTDYTNVKLLFNKISQIQYLPLFFDGYSDSLTINYEGSGGCGVPAVAVAAGGTISLSFEEVAKLFLFNSVNTTTTTLLIHFLKNIKACLTHFMTTDLKVVSDVQGKQIGDSQSDKIEGSLRELVKEIDKVVNFLKYNTLNLQEQTISLNNDVAPFNFGNNEHYIKNLFLGANVFFSYIANANQCVVMRFTTDDGTGFNWEGDKFFEFLNKIVGCTENSDIFGRTLKLLTDSNNEPTLGLSPYKTVTDAVVDPSPNNPYLQKIRTYIKDKPVGCFGGIPFTSIDPKVFSLLMRSFYLLLGLRLVVGTEIKQGIQVEEEELFSVLKKETKEAVRDKIKNTLTVASFSTLAESLKKKETISQANRMFNVIFGFLFGQAQRLIAEVNKAKEETNKAYKIGNKKNTKKTALFTGGGPTSIYTYRPTTNANRQNNIAKSEVNFIKTTYQTMAEFEYMMDTIMEKLKEEIDRRHVRNQLHFYYYIDTHFRNFKIYMETYLLTIGEKNIPPEMTQKLQQYIGYSPDKGKVKDSFLRLTTVPLIDPQYSDPLWWAKIESKFMDVQETRHPSTDSIYRLFIITTTPANWKTKLVLRDLYIVDAFALATLNNERSESVKWFSTGYRTHARVKTSKNLANQKIYLDSNTVIKLTGVVSQKSLFKMNSTKAQIKTQIGRNINKAIEEAINEDIRDLINGNYLYYDRQSNRYKKLIPIFLQADTHGKLSSIVNFQKNIMFRGYEKKFRSVSDGPDNKDYRIYEMADENIQDLKKYRQWLYSIFVEQQMKLAEPEKDRFQTIEKKMKESFKTLLTTNISGKCTRVYNIYDYIILHSLGGRMTPYGIPYNSVSMLKKSPNGPAPPQIDSVSIKYNGLSNSFDMGSQIVSGFISREDLIKLMLIY